MLMGPQDASRLLHAVGKVDKTTCYPVLPLSLMIPGRKAFYEMLQAGFKHFAQVLPRKPRSEAQPTRLFLA